MSQRTQNIFVKGMMQDIDPVSQPAGTYTDSLNGRLLFNADGSYSWEAAAGNSVSFALVPDYGNTDYTAKPVGAEAAGDELVIFSAVFDGATQVASEIGLVTFTSDGNGTYQTIFNDLYDPNGDTLDFNIEYPIVGAKYHFENSRKRRTYWTDRRVDVRAFNIVLGLQAVSEEFTAGDYNPVSGSYPPFYSVHNMNQNADVEAGTVDFDKHIGGNVYTGVYQYTYRLVTRDGYKTPFFPATRRIFVTSDSVNFSDWTQYEMEPVDELSSTGIQLQIDNIDQRYDRIEVAYIFGITSLAAKEATIFHKGAITSSSMTVQHVSNQGDPLIMEELPLFYDNIKTVQTIEIKDNRLWEGGITTAPQPSIDATGVTMQPKIRLLRHDINTGLLFSGGNYFTTTAPMTNSEAAVDGTNDVSLKQRLYTKANGDDVIKSRTIYDDYIAYKGTKTEQLFSGYFRGETYRLAAVCLDKKGNPSFAFHLGDFTFPQQYDNSFTRKYVDNNGVTQTVTSTSGSAGEFTLTDNGVASWDMAYEDANNLIEHDGKAHLKVMGLTISNIDLTDIINDISAIFIVRAERDASIMTQGLLISTLMDGAYTYPLGYPSNAFNADSEYRMMSGASFTTVVKDRDGDTYKYRPYVFTYECPDYMFNQSIIDEVQPSDRLKIVGACYSNDGNQNYGAIDSGLGTVSGTVPKSFVTKAYHTGVSNIVRNNNTAEWTFGAEASINWLEKFGAYAEFPLFPAQFTSQTFFAQSHVSEADGLVGSNLYDSTYHMESMVLVPEGITGDFEHLTAHTSDGRACCYAIVNYMNPKSNPYGGVNSVSIGNTIYYPTGYFLPITQQVKDDILTVGGDYILNGVEVWGGDCYINFHSNLRYYGHEDGVDDYSTAGALCFPVESKYNFSLRKGRSWEKVGTRDDGTSYPSGLTEDNKEEFNLNSVLLYREPNFFYNGVPDNFVAVEDFPNMWKYSEVKYSGEPQDNFRKFLTNSFGEVNGQYGGITGSFVLMDSIYSMQPHGFGRLRINDRAAIQSSAGETLRIGTGGVMDGIQYISHIYGTQHKCSIVQSNSAAYWVDVYNRGICKFSQAGFDIMSDSKGAHTFANTYLPSYKGKDAPTGAGGIAASFDFLNNEAVFIAKGVNGKEFTLTYNEMVDAFASLWSYKPNFIYNMNGYLYSMSSTDDNDSVYKHIGGAKGSFYGTVYNSHVEFVVNPLAPYSKVFDNGHIVAFGNIKTKVTEVKIETDVTTTQSIMASADSRVKDREGILNLPLRSATVSQPRMRGKYMKFKIITNNSTNSTLRINSVETLFRLSKNN